ncbi:MAG: BlaI/MecI/CopY family transcriptional regulator [Pirellulales bacterium]|nr:BlaI/MecI/CopY family transcriptional regulator [Pirellulales bacterium]
MKISDAEWLVMQVVWRHESVGAAEVIGQILPETDWNHRTVRTLLNRLVEKGALDAELIDGRNVYRPRVKQEQCLREESRSFLNKVFSGDAAEMLFHFVKNENISPEQVKQLKALLDEKQQGKGK